LMRMKRKDRRETEVAMAAYSHKLNVFVTGRYLFVDDGMFAK